MRFITAAEARIADELLAVFAAQELYSKAKGAVRPRRATIIALDRVVEGLDVLGAAREALAAARSTANAAALRLETP